MKHWFYFIVAACLFFGSQSCKKDCDHDNDLNEIKGTGTETIAKLEELLKSQEEISLKQQEEIQKLQEELLKSQEKISLTQQEEIKSKLEELLTSQEELSLKQQEEIKSKLEELLASQDELSLKQQEEIKSKLEELLTSQEELFLKQQEEIKKIQEALNNIGKEEPQDTTETNKDPEFKKYDNPGWVAVDSEGDYAYSMTAVFELPESIKANATDNDIIAAFVGKECRAVAKYYDGIFLLTIIGTGEETKPVTFRYWNAGNQYMYEYVETVSFTPDLIYGVVDEPKEFRFKQL